MGREPCLEDYDAVLKIDEPLAREQQYIAQSIIMQSRIVYNIENLKQSYESCFYIIIMASPNL